MSQDMYRSKVVPRVILVLVKSGICQVLRGRGFFIHQHLIYMRLSQLFSRTLREAPKDEESFNAQLLTRAGFVDKTMAGSYSFLPLGVQVLRRIETIVREEMDAVGGQEVIMSMLHPKALWETTGGWDNIDVLFKVPSRTGKEYALGQSEEEVVTPLVMKRAITYKDLPQAVYQIHWKFRDELRAKSGVMRGREFLMKDMYSFHTTQEDFERFYAIVKQAYLKAYARMGLVAKVTEASGGSFSEKISYEFMILTDAGEDEILYCETCDFCVNVEITKLKEGDACPQGHAGLKKAVASEAGNVFDLGQKYGKDFDLGYVDAHGEKQFPIMGCYGIGITRLMGIAVEQNHDEKGIIWHPGIAPADVHLIGLTGADAGSIYDSLQKKGVRVLFDDRDVSAGEKFKDADLIGIPHRLVVSTRNEGKIEWTDRKTGETALMAYEEVIQKL